MSRSAATPSLGHRIVRASVAVGVAHLLFKLAGLIQAAVMGRVLPKEVYDVFYVFAFENCIFSIFLLGEEVIGPAFLPVFMRELDTTDEPAAWRFANRVLSWQGLILLGAVALLMAFPGAVVRLWTTGAWSSRSQPEAYRMATRAIRALAPALLGLSIGSTTYMLLNGYKRFFLAAFGDAVWKFCVMAVLMLGMGLLAFGPEMLLLGLLLGSALKLVTHLVGLRDKLHLLRPNFRGRCPAVRGMLLLALPLILGILFAKVRDVFNNVTVLSHMDEAGLMQANSMGKKLMAAITWLIPYTLSIAMFPFFCEMVDRDDHQQLGDVVTSSGRMLLSVLAPIAIVAAVLARPLTTILFKGGHFDATAVTLTAISLACYTLVIPAAALETILMQAFFANRRMVAVTAIGILFSALSMAISYVGVIHLHLTGTLALGVVAGGFALSRMLKSTTLVILLKRSAPIFPAGPTARFLLRTALLALLCGGCARAGMSVADRLPFATGSKPVALAALVLGGAGATAAFVAGCRLFRVREPWTMLQWALKKRRGERLEGMRP